ncbi:MAG: polyprenol monophosphomannose synthase [Crocinitomicaceae bacterium TMED114]|nr:MAG: polyprenol monophosphomannose synthase [Crocinitomicaceae bacterium TMED114]
MSDSLVIIPTYNEKENIVRMLDTVMGLVPQRGEPFHVLVVDDGSPDGTADLVREAQDNHPGRIHLLERSGKLGLGTAYIAGFKWGLAEGYDYLFEMDADFSHNPKDLERLREACMDGAGVAVGSRYTQGGGVSNWPWHRIAMSYGASLYVNTVLGLGVKDPTAGFKCYRAKTLRAIRLDHIHFVGYAFQIEMKYNARQLGFDIAEVPITFIDREFGTSKMSLNIFREAFLGVLQMRRFDIQPATPTA